jgi:hypothetical protein
MPVSDINTVIDVFAAEVTDLAHDLVVYRELLSVALARLQAADVRHRELQVQFEVLREELRRYVRAQVTSA